MKSASNRGILKGRLQVLHVHVLFVAPLGASHMAQPGTDQHKGGVAVWETAHHTGAAANFPVEPLNDAVPPSRSGAPGTGQAEREGRERGTGGKGGPQAALSPWLLPRSAVQSSQTWFAVSFQ